MPDFLEPAFLKRALTLLVLAVLGVHAFVQYRRCGVDISAPNRWVFFGFSLIFLFGIAANFFAALLAIKYSTRQGPFEFGVFSLLIVATYIIFMARSNRYLKL